jgi:hypothetical protein
MMRLRELRVAAKLFFKLDQFLHLCQKPPIDLRQLVDAVDRPPHLYGIADVVEPTLRRHRELAPQFVFGNGKLLKAHG